MEFLYFILMVIDICICCCIINDHIDRVESNIDFLKDQIMTIRRYLEDQRRSNEKNQNSGS